MWSAHRVARRGRALGLELTASGAKGSFLTWDGFSLAREWILEDGALILRDRIGGRGRHRIDQYFICAPDAAGSEAAITLDPILERSTAETTVSSAFGKFVKTDKITGSIETELPVQLNTVIRASERSQ